MPLEKNQEIELAITGMSAQGSGVGRWVQEDGAPGLAVFVPFTAVGDRIRCHIVKVQKTHAFGRMSELLEPSADRLPADEAADCAAFGRCGGCAYRTCPMRPSCASRSSGWRRVKADRCPGDGSPSHRGRRRPRSIPQQSPVSGGPGRIPPPSRLLRSPQPPGCRAAGLPSAAGDLPRCVGRGAPLGETGGRSRL